MLVHNKETKAIYLANFELEKILAIRQAISPLYYDNKDSCIAILNETNKMLEKVLADEKELLKKVCE